MAAEMIEPARMKGFRQWLHTFVRGSDGHGETQTLTRGVDGRADLCCERARDCAHAYLANGLLDPREFELRFGGA